MSNPDLPEELLDHVADLLHDETHALKNCCLVSKSWIPRTRNHLFAGVAFRSPNNLRSWKKMFPDPSTSPAYYTRALVIKFPQVADAEEGCWIPTFSRVVNLKVDTRTATGDDLVRLTRLHESAPAIKSFTAVFATAQSLRISDLACSFPLVENLCLIGHGPRVGNTDGSENQQAFVRPTGQLSLTGSLKISVAEGMDPIASRLLALQDRLLFRELELKLCREGDVSLTRALIERCHPALETLRIHYRLHDIIPPEPINLSKATKLKLVTFASQKHPRWVLTTLRTVTSDHTDLQQISINPLWILFGFALGVADPMEFGHAIGEAYHAEWLELDRLLAQLRESHSIRLRVMYEAPSSMDRELARGYMKCLLPEVITRGTVEMVELV